MTEAPSSQYTQVAAHLAGELSRWTTQRWREEADRRRRIRADRLPAVTDARRALAAARRSDPERTATATMRAERELAEARRAVPDRLDVLAGKAAAGAGAAAYIGVPLVPGEVWLWGAVATVSAAVGGVGCLVARARRRAPGPGLVPTAEESRLLARLQPEHWGEHCELRGLTGTITARPELTPSGIVTQVRLDGTWTATKLRGAADHVRALLGCRAELRMDIKAGDRGGWAMLTLRTRSAADGVDLSGWTPGAPWGVDTVTGEPVTVPLGRRMLIAGTSGAGKSWSTRAILAEGSEYPDHRLVVIDPKRVEARCWEHRARTAVTPDEVLAVTAELVAEMHERLKLIPRGQDVIKISPERPRITIFVDEGAELISTARDRSYGRIMEDLRTLARMGRAAEVIIVWATQKPTLSGDGHGIDSQIAGQITYRAALALSTAGESRVVFGEDATDRGWHAHDLPMPGVAMLRSGPKARPHPIHTRAFGPADVIGLPDRPVWRRGAAASAVPPAPDYAPAVGAAVPVPVLRLVKATAAPGSEEPPAAPPAAPGVDYAAMTASDAVRHALAAAPDGMSVAELVEATSKGKSQVYSALSALQGDGTVTKLGRRYALSAGAA